MRTADSSVAAARPAGPAVATSAAVPDGASAVPGMTTRETAGSGASVSVAVAPVVPAVCVAAGTALGERSGVWSPAAAPGLPSPASACAACSVPDDAFAADPMSSTSAVLTVGPAAFTAGLSTLAVGFAGAASATFGVALPIGVASVRAGTACPGCPPFVGPCSRSGRASTRVPVAPGNGPADDGSPVPGAVDLLSCVLAAVSDRDAEPAAGAATTGACPAGAAVPFARPTDGPADVPAGKAAA